MRRESITYYFSVEGETEKWYLEWLQNSLNAEPDIPCAVKFVSKIQKNPLQYTKGLNIIQKTEITHLFDYEGGEDCVSNFQNILSLMKNAQTSKSITYRCGYCNFTFELWMVLHKADCNGLLANRYQYLPLINRVYDEHFENLDHFKREDNFKRVLFKLSLDDVRRAIERAKNIMRLNEQNGLRLQQYKGYRYYRENPSLSIWETMEKVVQRK